jgi:hypothetical protein
LHRRLLYVLGCLLSLNVMAEVPEQAQPNWVVEVKGGLFYPETKDWKRFYGEDYMSHFSASLSYKLLNSVQIGMEGGWMKDNGTGMLPTSDTLSGDVKYEAYPLSVFAQLRAIFYKNQFIVPYLGGGWTRVYYRETIKTQETVKGSTDGYYYKAGLQFLLNSLDKSSASRLSRYGIDNTYFLLEAQKIDAEVDGTEFNIGGMSYFVGVAAEF